tara:strand:- start:524 stop:1117 length:594 start_codon:yes stop_codon:yes gene_type:complete
MADYADGMAPQKVEELFNENYKSLVTTASASLGNRQDGEDCVSHLFVNVIRASERCQFNRRLLYVSLRNLIIDYVRRRKARSKRFNEYGQMYCRGTEEGPEQEYVGVYYRGEITEEGPEQELVRDNIQQVVEAAIKSLNPEQSYALTRFFIDGISHKELAAELGAPIGTVLCQVHRAKGKLRNLPLIQRIAAENGIR